MIEKPTYEELEKRIQELELTESEHKQTEESWRISQLRYSRIEERLKNKYLFYTRSIDGERFLISWLLNSYCPQDGPKTIPSQEDQCRYHLRIHKFYYQP